MAEKAKDKLMELLLTCKPRPNLKDTDSIISSLLTPSDKSTNNSLLCQLQSFLDIQPDFQEKDKSFLIHFTSEGVSKLKRKSWREASELFSKALRHVPNLDTATDSCSQRNRKAELFAYRSECSFFLLDYMACSTDIDNALQANYVDKHVLYDRQGKCFVALQCYDKAAYAFKQGKKVLPEDMCQKEKDKWLQSFNQQLKSLKGMPTPKHIDKSPKNDILKSTPKALSCRKGQICSTSGDLKIKASEDFGHYVVANKDIPAGTALLRSNAYASVLFEECRKANCYGCMKAVKVSFPCRNCSGIVYCSAECEATCWKDFHQYECTFQEWLNEDWATRLGHLTLRLAMKTMKCALHRLVKETTNNNAGETNGIEDGSEQVQNSFYDDIEDAMYNDLLMLIRHETIRDTDRNVQMIAICVLLYDILIKSDYIAEHIQSQYPKIDAFRSQSGIDKFVLNHLLCMMQTLQCNGFTIAQMRNASDMAHSKPKDLGLGIYLHCSYFNHSCDPDVDITFHGSHMMINAIKDIRKGDQVYVDYGFTFYLDEKEKRRDYLRSQYFFDCACRACEEDWPLWHEMETRQPRFKCKQCGATLTLTASSDFTNVACSVCGTTHDIASWLPKLSASHEDYKKHMAFALEGEREKALPGLLKHLSLLQRTLQSPWQEYYGCQAAIKQCFRLRGNTD